MANKTDLVDVWESDLSIGRKLVLTLLYPLTTWYGLVLMVIVCVAIVFGRGGGNGNSTTNLSSTEDAQKYISGKTFVGTPSNELWFKIVFTGNTVSLWSAIPQSGGWGSKKTSSSYEVEQARYTDNGQTYFYVMIGDYNESLNYYKFDITGKRLYLAIAYDDTGTPMKEGDRNPWN